MTHVPWPHPPWPDPIEPTEDNPYPGRLNPDPSIPWGPKHPWWERRPWKPKPRRPRPVPKKPIPSSPKDPTAPNPRQPTQIPPPVPGDLAGFGYGYGYGYGGSMGGGYETQPATWGGNPQMYMVPGPYGPGNGYEYDPYKDQSVPIRRPLKKRLPHWYDHEELPIWPPPNYLPEEKPHYIPPPAKPPIPSYDPSYDVGRGGGQGAYRSDTPDPFPTSPVDGGPTDNKRPWWYLNPDNKRPFTNPNNIWPYPGWDKYGKKQRLV